MGRYILDFYCPSERLCIELDGAHHVDPIIQDYDNVRTAFLVLQGIRVLRFTNLEAIEKTDDVIQRIVNELFSPPPAPSWEEGKYTL